MGAVGSATTTLIVRILLALYMLNYIYRMRKNPKLNKRFGLDRSYDTWWNDSKTTRHIGYGVAIMTIATNGSFSIVNTFAGWLGEATLAILIIMINISSLIFMLCFSIGQATSIVVAGAYGKKDYKGILVATNAGYVISLSVILTLITIVYNFPNQIFGMFTQDANVLKAINGYIIYVLINVFIDTLPINVNATLNGQGDVKIPTIFQIISFLIVRISACYYLAFVADWGLKGLILGLSCGGICSLILNSGRLIVLAKRNKLKISTSK